MDGYEWLGWVGDGWLLGGKNYGYDSPSTSASTPVSEWWLSVPKATRAQTAATSCGEAGEKAAVARELSKIIRVGVCG